MNDEERSEREPSIGHFSDKVVQLIEWARLNHPDTAGVPVLQGKKVLGRTRRPKYYSSVWSDFKEMILPDGNNEALAKREPYSSYMT